MLPFSSTPSEIAPLVGKRVFDVVIRHLHARRDGAHLRRPSPIAIKLGVPGPIFFRSGAWGSTAASSGSTSSARCASTPEEKLASCAEERDGWPGFQDAQDPRVTRVGSFIRKSSLDEFPQFHQRPPWRDERRGAAPAGPSEVRLYKRWQGRRLSVKPGITCTWQVSGRNRDRLRAVDAARPATTSTKLVICTTSRSCHDHTRPCYWAGAPGNRRDHVAPQPSDSRPASPGSRDPARRRIVVYPTKTF